MNSNSYMQRVQAQYQGTSGFVAVVFIILVLVAIGYLIYWAVNSKNWSGFNSQMNPVIISEPMNAFNNHDFDKGIALPVSNQGLEFTYSYWIYIADWSYNFGKRKYIFVKGSLSGDQGDWSPAMWLDETLNTLRTSMAVFTPEGSTQKGGSGGAERYSTCDVRDIPLQKWVYISYVFNNRNVDIYVDGKLEKSCLLAQVPYLNRSDLYIMPQLKSSKDGITGDTGFYGQISNFQYFSRALLPTEVSTIYANGPYAAL